MEQYLVWDLLDGSCSFWWDNWLGTGPLVWQFPAFTSHALVREFWQESWWNLPLIYQLFSEHMYHVAQSTSLAVEEGADSFLWSLSSSGNFEAAFIRLVLEGGSPTSWTCAHIWDPGLPMKISFFMWRVLGNRLPLREALFKLRVVGPFKCFCCSSSKFESLDHLFVDGEFTNMLRKYFEGRWGSFV